MRLGWPGFPDPSCPGLFFSTLCLMFIGLSYLGVGSSLGCSAVPQPSLAGLWRRCALSAMAGIPGQRKRLKISSVKRGSRRLRRRRQIFRLCLSLAEGAHEMSKPNVSRRALLKAAAALPLPVALGAGAAGFSGPLTPERRQKLVFDLKRDTALAEFTAPSDSQSNGD